MSRAVGWRVSLRLLAAGLAPLLGGCSKSPPPSTASLQSGKANPAAPANVLLISMDTTRADCLGCYGHPRAKTPHIDRLAARGALFSQCVTAAPITAPSHASMFTGLYPKSHGVRDNGAFVLGDEQETVAEALSQAGYATAAVVGAFVLNREYGLAQGFGAYDDLPEVDGVRRPERPASEVADAAIAWLRERPDKPFFLFVHFFDPHQPYLAPQRFETGPGAATQQEVSAPGAAPAGYLAEIAFVDEQIGRLLEALDAFDLASRTLVILTADHGESLGEHDEATHACFLYDATMRVPLVMRGPDVPAGTRVEDQVRTIDLAPTILAAARVDALPKAHGTNLLKRLGDSGEELPAIGESLYLKLNFGFAPLRMWRESGWKYIQAPNPELYDLSADPRELNNLAAAQPDRAREMKERLRTSLAALESSAESAAGKSLSEAELQSLAALGYVGGASQAEHEELDAFEADGPNPRDQAEQIGIAIQASNLMQMGQDLRAELMLRALLESAEEGEYSWACASLAGALAKQGKFDEAIPFFQRSLAGAPNHADTWAKLGMAMLSAGRFGDAVQAFRSALERQPEPALARRMIPVALALHGEPDAALTAFTRAEADEPARRRSLSEFRHALRIPVTEADPVAEFAAWAMRLGYPNAALKLLADDTHESEATPNSLTRRALRGEALHAVGEHEHAAIEFRRTTEAAPGNAFLLDRLAGAQVSFGKYIEAADAWRRATELEPADAGIARRRAWLLATCPDPRVRDGAEAVRLAERARSTAPAPEPDTLATLSAAFAETGEMSRAREFGEQALALAVRRNNAPLAGVLRARLERIKAGKPIRDPAD